MAELQIACPSCGGSENLTLEGFTQNRTPLPVDTPFVFAEPAILEQDPDTDPELLEEYAYQVVDDDRHPLLYCGACQHTWHEASLKMDGIVVADPRPSGPVPEDPSTAAARKVVDFWRCEGVGADWQIGDLIEALAGTLRETVHA